MSATNTAPAPEPETQQAVVFDLLGTLVGAYPNDTYTAMLRRVGSGLGGDPEEFLGLWKKIYEQRTTGEFTSTRLTVEWMCRKLALAPTAEQMQAAVAARLEYTVGSLVPHDGILDLLGSLKDRGLKLGLISDCSADIPDVWPDTALAPFFDVATFSCIAGVRKPAPEIYTLTCQKLGVDPKACTYVGDGGNSELTGAREVGMHPVKVVFEPEEEIFRMGHDDGFAGPEMRSVAALAAFIAGRG